MKEKKSKHTKHSGHAHEPFFGGKILTGIILLIFLLFLGVFLLVVFDPIGREQPVQIAALLPLTGNDAIFGLSYKEGIDLALDDLNENGRKITVRYFDSESNPEKALDQYFNIVQNGYTMILGPVTTSEADMIAPYAEMYKTIMVTYATGVSLSHYNHYIFRFQPSDSNFLVANINFLTQLGITDATMIYAENTLGITTYAEFREIAEEYGISVTGIPIISLDYVVSELEKYDTIWIYVIPETPQQLVELMNEAVARNLTKNTLWIAADSAFGDDVRDSPETLGTVVQVPTFSTYDPDFLEKYRKKFGVEFDVSKGRALYGYDSMFTLGTFVNDVNVPTSELADALKHYRYLGLTGPVVFTENLERTPMYEIYYAELGTWRNVPVNYLFTTYVPDVSYNYQGVRNDVVEAYLSGKSIEEIRAEFYDLL